MWLVEQPPGEILDGTLVLMVYCVRF